MGRKREETAEKEAHPVKFSLYLILGLIRSFMIIKMKVLSKIGVFKHF